MITYRFSHLFIPTGSVGNVQFNTGAVRTRGGIPTSDPLEAGGDPIIINGDPVVLTISIGFYLGDILLFTQGTVTTQGKNFSIQTQRNQVENFFMLF